MIALIRRKLIASLIDKVSRCIADINALGKTNIELTCRENVFGSKVLTITYDGTIEFIRFKLNTHEEIRLLKETYKDLKQWRKALIARYTKCKHIDKE